MKSRKMVIFGIVMVLILDFSLTATARGWRAGGPGMGKGFVGLIKNLGLTDAQKRDIAETLLKYRDEATPLMDSLVAARESLAGAIHAEPMVEDDVRKAFQEVASIKVELSVLKAKAISEVRPLLTTEQLEQITDKRANMKERMKERIGKKRERIGKMLEEWAALEE